MASTNLANVPYFFKGSYNNLVTSLAPGGLFQNLNKAGFAFVTDKNCMAYVDTDKTVTLIGDVSDNVQPEKGTVANPIILDTLPAGVYSISGEYQVTASAPVQQATSNQLFVVSSTGGVTQMDGDAMSKIDMSSGTPQKEDYVTDKDINDSIANSSDISSLF